MDKGHSVLVTTTLGRQIGNYRVLRLLGQGGFADVYLGEHLYLKTHAAIKVLHTYLASRDVHHFIKEAQTIARLNHSHIVRVFDFGLDVTTPYLVMDYASNGTLRQRHPRGSIVPLTLVISYVKQVAAALQYAHDAKLIHRDVKPENMLLGRNNEVILSDFGIAVAAHSTSSRKTLDRSGTPYYMAPECIQGKPRPASDQYALGVVVYEWLCGTPPFLGEPMQVFYQHVSTPPPPLHEKVPTISCAVERVVLRALSKDPQRRFESIEAFAIALEQAVQPHRRVATLCTYGGQTSEVLALAWSPDGSSIASIDSTADARLWDAKTGETLSFFNCLGNRMIRAIAWSLDGKYITIGDDNYSIAVWNAASGELRNRRRTSGRVEAIVWSPDGKRFAAGSIGKIYPKNQEYIVQVWNGHTGDGLFEKYLFISRDLREEGVEPLNLARKGVVSIRWLPDSRCMEFVRHDMIVEVWDTTTCQQLSARSLKGGAGNVHTVAWSPNGKCIAAIMLDQTIEVWNAITGSALCSYRGHVEGVKRIAWSPGSQYLASYCADGTMYVLDVASSTHCIMHFEIPRGAGIFAWSPEGKRIASVIGDHRIRIWQVG